MRVFHAISRKLPARLLLLGEGPELGHARELVAELGMKDIVIFNGPCAHMGEVLRCGHLFMLLSEYESFGLSALEAMACGVPVLASDAGGLREVVVQGKTGILVKPGEIAEAAASAGALLADPEAWERMSEAAVARVREAFDVETIVEQYEDFYRGL